MSKQMVTREQAHIEYIDKNLDLIANQNQLNKRDLENFAIQCKRTGLDPITRQIYAIPNGGKMTIMASIDGLRLIAERSGAYEGQTKPEWCDKDGKWHDVWVSKDLPTAARIGVYKSKFREALYGVALFGEYAGMKGGKLTYMWEKMPALMIAKVAEALALRKAFPNEMSGVYAAEEMDQADHGASQAQKNVSEINDLRKETGFDSAPAKKAKPEIAHEETASGEHIIDFGKHKGKKLGEVDIHEMCGYVDWLENKLQGSGVTGKLRDMMQRTVDACLEYRAQLTKKDPSFDASERMDF